ncbi:MAG: delta-60 repeat domain-containing protein [Flavobacteriales bacterium]|nr:delta-60 repeat domain-containing protein [Flavobacteriales bacterium]
MASLRPASHALVIGLLTTSTAFAQAPPLAWEAFVDGSLPGIDEARGLVVAPDNSIYVTGSSANIAPQGTITTVRYAPNGTQLWIDHPYGPSQSAENKGVALAIAPRWPRVRWRHPGQQQWRLRADQVQRVRPAVEEEL